MQQPLYLALGTNLGDRGANIKRALELLDEKFQTHYTKLSGIIESKAQGFTGPDFLNCAVLYYSDIPPLEALALCKAVEREMGRTVEGVVVDASGARVYRDRVIDIDILRYGDVRMETPCLTIPHPRMEERDFVMGPLKEIMV